MADGFLPVLSADPQRAAGLELELALRRPLLDEIAELKRARGAVILAHNYMTPDIFHGVGDFRGDSLALAKEAAKVSAPVIVQAGVHFMAETSKVLSPDTRCASWPRRSKRAVMRASAC